MSRRHRGDSYRQRRRHHRNSYSHETLEPRHLLAADLVIKGISQSILDGHVTYDLARLMKREGREDITEVSCSGFGRAIVERM